MTGEGNVISKQAVFTYDSPLRVLNSASNLLSGVARIHYLAPSTDRDKFLLKQGKKVERAENALKIFYVYLSRTSPSVEDNHLPLVRSKLV